MRYLSNYDQIKESVAYAKKYWKQKFPELDNFLLPAFQEIFSKNPGYIGDFMRMVMDYISGAMSVQNWEYNLKQNDETASQGFYRTNIYRRMKECYDNLLKYKNILPNLDLSRFETIEQLNDFIENSKIENDRKNNLKRFLSSKYYGLLTPEIIKQFSVLTESLKMTDEQLNDLVFKKIAAYNNPNEFLGLLKSISNKSSNWNKTYYETKVEHECSSSWIIHEDSDSIIIKVGDFSDMSILGSKNWCIARDDEYWDQYNNEADVYDNAQYIICDFSKDQTDNTSMIGVTVGNSGVYAAHLLNDDPADKSDYSKWMQYLKPATKDDVQGKLSYEQDLSVIAKYDAVDRLKEVLGEEEDDENIAEEAFKEVCSEFAIECLKYMYDNDYTSNIEEDTIMESYEHMISLSFGSIVNTEEDCLEFIKYYYTRFNLEQLLSEDDSYLTLSACVRYRRNEIFFYLINKPVYDRFLKNPNGMGKQQLRDSFLNTYAVRDQIFNVKVFEYLYFNYDVFIAIEDIHWISSMKPTDIDLMFSILQKDKEKFEKIKLVMKTNLEQDKEKGRSLKNSLNYSGEITKEIIDVAKRFDLDI